MSELLAVLLRLLRSPAFKFMLICFLILMLLIPMLLVSELVNEREGRSRSVRAEIARLWGRPQQITGPFLIVPYTIRGWVMEKDKRVETTFERRAVFLPETLDVKGKTRSKVLHRGIYEANVYEAALAISGRFASPDMHEMGPDVVSVRWRDAVISFMVADVSGLKQAAVVRFDGGETVSLAPSLGVPTLNQPGIHARLSGAGARVMPSPDKVPDAFSFSVDLTFSGSTTLEFAPAARETVVSLESDWPHPSFWGAFLPAERKITDTGFTATWRVPHLARSVPQAWSLSDFGLERFNQSMFGVNYYLPVDFYAVVSRAVKYGVLFLGLAFMAVFVLELLSRRSVHPVQYLFTGIALIFFYVLLLSLSEHVGFALAYLAASLATGTMLSVYVSKSLDSRRLGAVMAAIFALLYGLLYLILRLEDYALLAGAIMGFAMLTTAMFATLRVDWSGGAHQPAKMPQAAG